MEITIKKIWNGAFSPGCFQLQTKMFDKYHVESGDNFEVKKKKQTTLELKLNPDSCGEKGLWGEVPTVGKRLLL